MKINRLLFVCWFTHAILIATSACQTFDYRSPEEKAKQAEATAKVTRFQEQHRKFNLEAMALIQEVTLLKNHPGWPDMEKILNSVPSVQYIEGREEADRKLQSAILEWNRKWDAPGKDMIVKYRDLVERSGALELQRAALLKEWNQVYNEWVVLVLTQSAEPMQVVKLSKILDERTRSSLNEYALDQLGLLYARGGDEKRL
ncbi:MAG: hypothetical protein HY050_02145 [Actinobacteria bacterium]|nr:hypothetical protein [Actinomycetota bacterium]